MSWVQGDLSVHGPGWVGVPTDGEQHGAQRPGLAFDVRDNGASWRPGDRTYS